MTQVEKDALLAALQAHRAFVLSWMLPRNRVACDTMTNAIDAILVLVNAITVTP